ncbi:MAG: choice-of-anchor J domain-containing protein [Bacteroidota bacterium]
MKRLVLSVLLLFSIASQAQVLFSEDFDDQTMPPQALFFDLDSATGLLALDSSIDPANWYIYAHPRDPADFFAWASGLSDGGDYRPVDNWMVIPDLSILPQTTLFFDTRKVGINNLAPEYVEVWVSKAGTDPADFTENISTILTTGGWTAHTVDLSAYANQSIHIAFVGKAEAGAHIGLNNINIISASNEIFDVDHQGIALENNYLLPGNYDLFLSFQNNSTVPINRLDVNYSFVGDTTVVVQTVENLDVAVLEVDNLNLADFIDLNAVGAYRLEVWLSNPNGIADANPADNAQNLDVVVLTQGAPKKVLLEEFTGTWCVWCPRGPIVLEELKSTFGEDLIVVAHHNDDPMEIETSANLIVEMDNLLLGFPSGTTDRYRVDPSTAIIGVDTDLWESYTAQRLNHLTSAELQATVSYDPELRLLSISSEASFVADDIGDIRLNCLITENDVTGYPQRNNYNEDPTTYPSLYQAGDPIVDYVHQDVLRAMLGGTYGLPGIIPDQVDAGDRFSHTFTYTVPAQFDVTNMNVVLLLTKHEAEAPEDRHFVINSAEFHFEDFLTQTEELTLLQQGITIFPNPLHDQLTLQYTQATPSAITLSDAMGRVVWRREKDIPSGQMDLNFGEMAPGIYFLSVSGEKIYGVEKLVIW